ncbi:MAG: ABC transporter permease, partial [Sedimentisphaerales bacterium]|nr:ABC transporter permease [Sedimentisphaerales bacterium]
CAMRMWIYLDSSESIQYNVWSLFVDTRQRSGILIDIIGEKTIGGVVDIGRFARFLWHTAGASVSCCFSAKTWPLVWTQVNIIGVRSVPVIMITGGFVGMTLAYQAYEQLAGMGLEEHLGALVNISVVKELGPVLSGVMLAGRVGGALTAELGTMNVTEQIDAVRSMGTDPMRYLVAPRVLACLLLTPFLIVYADLLGVLGGYFVSSTLFGINGHAYWEFSSQSVALWDIAIGVVKGFFFGAAIAAASCYKGFTCKQGAHGVGQACTDAFVASFISILALDFALAVIFKALYNTLYPLKSLI